MRSALLITTSLFSICLYACTTHAPSDSSSSQGGTPATENAPASNAPNTPVAESRAKGVLIGTIVTHDSRVSILGRGPSPLAEPGSPKPRSDIRVVVKKDDGTLVADGITLDELRKIDPTAHTLVTNAVAGEGTKSGDFIDATNTQGGKSAPRDLGAPQGGQPLHLLDF